MNTISPQAPTPKLRFYPVVNDLIGGWDVSIHNKTVGDHRWQDGEVTMGTFMSKEDADLVANALNFYLASMNGEQ